MSLKKWALASIYRWIVSIALLFFVWHGAWWATPLVVTLLWLGEELQSAITVTVVQSLEEIAKLLGRAGINQ